MIPAAWKYAYASVVGTRHSKQSVPCQDSSECRVLASAGGPVLVAVASDGAGSAGRAEVGAALATSLFVEEVESLLARGGGLHEVTQPFVGGWVARFQAEVQERSRAEEMATGEFACTLLAALVAADGAAFLQIGDGAIVKSAKGPEGNYECIFWPQQGEYANVTNFVTDANAWEKLDYILVGDYIEEVALLTDGLQNLALHWQSRTAYSPFFRSMFTPLHGAGEGHLEDLSFSLASYLESPKINDRTDDDKTLILATRRG